MSSQESRPSQESIEQTKQQIRSLVAEISQLSKSDMGAEEYYAAFLQKVVAALAAVGGAVWIVSERKRLELAYQINLSQGLLDSSSEDAGRHSRLLDYIVQTDEGTLVPPLSGASDDKAGGNPSRFLLVLHPLRSDGKVEGVVEVFQRPDSPPATQRGYLRFLQQMTELAGEWLKTQKLKQFSDRHSLWAHADQFSRMVHEGLDVRETAYAVANEGRRLIGCDRVCVALMKGRKCVVEAVSGQDVIENRSNIAAALSNLATRVVATGEPLWYEGSTEDLPPQIERALEEYVDESYAKSVIVLPLYKPKPLDQAARDAATKQVEREQDHVGELIGALIVEQIETDLPRSIITPRLDLVYEHSARAIANASDYSSLFLMPVWRALGRASWVLQARTLPKTLAIAGVILLLAIMLVVVPKDFYLKAKGSLQPADRRDVFVPDRGRIQALLVKDQQTVTAGQELIVIENNDLRVQFQDIQGQLDATLEQLNSVINALRPEVTRDDGQRVQLGGQKRELDKRKESLEKQLELLREKQKQLTVRSPIDGIVLMSWDVERSLLNRTVEPGQILMTVADPTKEWELELFMPERRAGHVDVARADKSASPLDVAYILATAPNVSRSGKVSHVERITQMHDEEGHSVRIRVAVDKTEISDPRPGAAVTAKVLCGRRSLGYCWFHEAFEWLQANVLF